MPVLRRLTSTTRKTRARDNAISRRAPAPSRKVQRDAVATPWSGPGLVGRGPALLLHVGSRVHRPGREPDAPAPKADLVTETVSVLDARKSGDLALELRGAGEDRVKMTIKNNSTKRLNVVLPPGLVASSLASQGPGGRGGGFQSMGLGAATNRPGTFGNFQLAANGGPTAFRSVGVNDAERNLGVTVAGGESVTLTLTSVCLNYGVATPTPRNTFELVSVDDYSSDLRVRKALKSLATFGTGQGVAQAVMWNVCNGVTFDVLSGRSSKSMNAMEIALAARFVDALDHSS